MKNDTKILSKNQEIFTVVESGESGASLRGVSRLSGIPQKTLSRWFESDLSHEAVPESLKALSGKLLYLSHEVKVRGKLIKAIRSEIVAEVIEYAALELGKPEAKLVLKATNKIGTASFFHGETGFLPEKYTRSTSDARNEIARLIKDPDPWKILYSAETCERVRKWYFPKNFFWKFAYDWMTQEEIDFLNAHNPVIPGIWQRENRIFQHLSQETRDRLAPEINVLCVLVNTSTSRQDFETRYNRGKGADQQELLDA
jgi:hypothetical protein